jgi:hypothetical protein
LLPPVWEQILLRAKLLHYSKNIFSRNSSPEISS